MLVSKYVKQQLPQFLPVMLSAKDGLMDYSRLHIDTYWTETVL